MLQGPIRAGHVAWLADAAPETRAVGASYGRVGLAERGGGREARLPGRGQPQLVRRPGRGDAEGHGQALRAHGVHVRTAAALPERKTELASVAGNLEAGLAVAVLRAGLVDVVLDTGLGAEDRVVAAAALVVELPAVVPVAAVPAPVLPVLALAVAALLLGDAHKLVEADLSLGRLVSVHAARLALGHPARLSAVGAEAARQHLPIGLVELVGVCHANAKVPPPPTAAA
mmetsp:Transcript_22420/g.46486  ORF Transcript_22420/g.46486 Transcript_22420/m.46486 type:complete len:229 (+) Transcript_22420:658-1344(+)